MYNDISDLSGNLPDNKKLLDEEKRHLDIFTSIADSCVDLKINFNDMLLASVKKLAEYTNDLSVIYLFGVEEINLDAFYSYYPDDNIRTEIWDLQKNNPLIIQKQIPEEILKTGLPFIVPFNGDRLVNPDFLSFEYNAFLQRYSFSSMIILPININNKSIGILSLSRIDSKLPYTDYDQTFLQSIANLLASVISNSRLYKEKELLLRELHHRIKNNLQVISSLLSIQSDYVTDVEAHKLFLNSLNRIRTMSLIYDNLLPSGNFSVVDIDKYFKDLVIYLCRTYNVNTSRIKIEINVGLASLPVETSITIGLIVNELVSNAIKYAFPGERSGIISLSLVKFPKQNKLIVSDDGVGLPELKVKEDKETFGLLLIRTLTDQLYGTMEVISKKGAKFIIMFPDNYA
jgi:two-component sensor histidine kinase